MLVIAWLSFPNKDRFSDKAGAWLAWHRSTVVSSQNTPDNNYHSLGNSILLYDYSTVWL